MLLIPNRGPRPVEINRFTIDKIRKGRVSGSCVLSKYEITTSFVIAQTPRAVVVELATVHTSTIQGVFLAIQSSLRPVVSEKQLRFCTIERIWTTVRSLVLCSECSPTGLMLIEKVPIDPDLIATPEELVCSVCEWSAARVCRCSKRVIPINV